MTPSLRPPITLADLGRVLDLDKSTVSLALRGSARIAEDTRRRVQDAAQLHGYRPNLAARQLIRGPRGLSVIGLYLSDQLSSLLGTVAVATIRQIAKLAEEQGLLFQLLSTSALGSTTTTLRPDAALVWGDVPYASVASILAPGKRALVLDAHHSSYSTYQGATVGLDNIGGGARMAQLMSERKARRLLFVQVLPGHLGHRDRWQGARSAWIQQHPIDSVSICQLEELTDAQLVQFCAEPGGAILCASDGGAFTIWRRLQKLGLSAPRSTLLAGFDGEHHAIEAGITTAVFDSDGLARAAFAAVTGPLPLPRLPWIPFRLHLGDTT